MEYSENTEKAKELAGKAMQSMDQFEVPATPRNFAVWYTHHSGHFPDLSKALEPLIRAKKPLTDEQSLEIYDRFFGGSDESEVLQEASEKISDSVMEVMGLISDATRGASEYGDSLQENLGQLGEQTGLEGIKGIVESIVEETRKVQKQNEALEAKLKTSSDEINSLRQRMEDVQREAMTDALTGIANRKYFDQTLRIEARGAIESGDPLCLLLTDIDHFKQFNDTYGHQTGDQVLKLVGKTLVENVKGKDTAARYGGEEFALILPHTSLEEAQTVGETIRKAVASKRIRNRQTGEDMGNITLSIGAAILRPGEPLSDLIQRADEGLYQAKRNGRNQVVIERDLETVSAA